MNHPDWELHSRAFRDTGTATSDVSLVLEDGPLLDTRFSHLRSIGLPDGSSSQRARRRPFRYERVFGLGGTTLHYQGEAHRFPEHAFRPASRYGFGVDWPVGYNDLAQYYERAEQLLGVSGDPANPFKPPRGPFPNPPHRLSYASQRIARGAAKLGWQLLPNPLALPTRSVDGRSPCQRSGGCVQGCIFGAKSSVDQTAIRRGEQTGRLQIRTESRVLEIEMGRDGRADAVVYRIGKTNFRVRTRALVLAAGALETPRLLLAQSVPGHSHGLANASGLVGRYLMETVSVMLSIRFAERIDAYKGPPIDSRIWDFCLPRRDSAVRSGYVLGVAGTAAFHGPVSYALRIPGIGQAHKNMMRAQFGTVLTLFGIAEQEPRAENRVTLAEARDVDGIPMLRVETAHSEADLRASAAMLARVKELARACGAAEILQQVTSYDVPAAAHVAGTCRMGLHAESSVVDPYGRCHDVRNLFITDASVLPGQGAGDSPSLTIQALALRTAERIATLARRHEL